MTFILAMFILHGGSGVAYGSHDKGCGAEKATIEICTRVIESGKYKNNRRNLAITYNTRGRVYANNQKFNRAIDDYNRALKLNPKLTIVYHNRGASFASRGNFNRAIKDLSRFIGLNPNHAGAYYVRGFAFEGKGDLERAIRDYKKSLKLNPKMTYAKKSLYDARKKQTIARIAPGIIRDWTQGKKIKSAKTYYNIGVSLKSRGRYADAITNFTKAIKLNPKYLRAYNSRGYAYLRSGAPRRAIVDFQRTIVLSPKDGGRYHSLGDGLYYAGQKDKAMKVWKKACALVSRTKAISWQRKLKRAGHYSGKIDGKCGFGTVIAFASCAEAKCRAL
jgi:tetratricopeptide (TPR) repeat protein